MSNCGDYSTSGYNHSQPPTTPKLSFSFCKDNFRDKGKGLLFKKKNIYILFSEEGQIYFTGISDIRKHRNISLVTRVLRRYELFTTSKKSLCVGIACEINFCLQQKEGVFTAQAFKI